MPARPLIGITLYGGGGPAMKPYDEQRELANYAWRHCREHFTAAERKAYWAHLAERMKVEKGRDVVDDTWKTHKLAEDPAVMAILKNGVEQFCLPHGTTCTGISLC